MKELPLLYSTSMVQATLDRLKSQTRRVITPNNTVGFAIKKKLLDFSEIFPNGKFGVKVKELASDALWRGQCKWQPGDLLYVRETWTKTDNGNVYVYKADAKDSEGKYWDSITPGDPNKEVTWKPSIHMPKEASRIWLRVKDVRAERVQDISEQDAIAEGINGSKLHEIVYGPNLAIYGGPVIGFQKLWNSINAKRENGQYAWDSNPWVWVIDFDVLSTTGRPEELN